MEKKKVSIVTPAKGGLPWYFMQPLIEALTTNHEKFSFNFMMESGHNAIGIARNIIADNVIKHPEGIWKLVMIDSDAFWTYKQLLQIVDHEEPFVAAPYVRKKSGDVSWLAVRTPGTDTRADGMMPADFVGPHMMAFDVAALKQMVAAYPDRMFTIDEVDGESKQKTMCELFPIGLWGPNTPEGRIRRIRNALVGRYQVQERDLLNEIENIITEVHPGESRMLGEDYGFCALARKAGFKLYCDLNTNPVGHVGDVIYPIGPEQLSKATPFPTHNLEALNQW